MRRPAWPLWTPQQTDMNAAGTNPSDAFVLLNLGRHRFALSSENIAELAPPVRLHTFAHRTPLVSGVIVRRGRIIPVYDVASVLMGGPGLAGRFYLITTHRLAGGEELCAIPVTAGCELKMAKMTPPTDGCASYVRGFVNIENEQIEVLDLNALLAPPQAPAEAAAAEPRQ
jgi:chemotaxis signal transduction protein